MANAENPGTTAAGGTRVEIDTSVAHEARVYDYWLGGKDNYPADREFGDMVAQRIPTVRAMARANRDFLGRAVRHLVRDAGIRQFLDIGTGIPTSGNVHEIAQRIAPETRVVYVDKDPIVLAHARALMNSTPQGRTRFIHADLHDPKAILTDPALTETLDLTKPVAIMLVAIMMYFPDSDDPHGIISTLFDAVPPGSYLTLSHATADFDPDTMNAVVAAAQQAGFNFLTRTRAETEALATRSGLDLIEPGIVPVLGWRPDTASHEEVVPLRPGTSTEVDPESAYYWCLVARKN